MSFAWGGKFQKILGGGVSGEKKSKNVIGGKKTTGLERKKEDSTKKNKGTRDKKEGTRAIIGMWGHNFLKKK